MVRIEEVCVGASKNYEFTKDKWIEHSGKVGDLVYPNDNNEVWIIVEVR